VTPPLAPLGAPVQIAYAVPDALDAAERWVADHGAGPFFVRAHIELVDVIHRGRPATFDHTSAYGQWGSIMVELVEDHTDGPSVVRDMFPPGGGGLHHLAYIVDDVPTTIRTLADRGHELAMSARTSNGTEFHFVDAVATYGHFLELYPPSERLREFYAIVAEAAVGWNGADPVRML
jgi:Glyoxalase/Bleomycin resistance protein/Dioxygenase superfamily